jgi:hypothetical protein
MRNSKNQPGADLDRPQLITWPVMAVVVSSMGASAVTLTV